VRASSSLERFDCLKVQIFLTLSRLAFIHCHAFSAFSFPASFFPSSDSYTFSDGDMRYNGSNPELMPGSLLAIPPSVADSVKTTTVPGAKIKQALVDYGAYIVDDTAGDSVSVMGGVRKGGQGMT
jgi:hypothetical protein